jgi:hypothetical protein
MEASLNIQKRDLNREESLLNAKIGKIPVQERQFRVIARQQKSKGRVVFTAKKEKKLPSSWLRNLMLY